MDNPLIEKINTINVKVKNCTFNEYNRPVLLTTSKDLEYHFPKMILTNQIRLLQLKGFLKISNKITIMHDQKYRIHRINDIQLCWNESNIYKLMIVSLTKGLLFNDQVEVIVYENIHKYYKNHGYEKFFRDGLEITIIIKDKIDDIPVKY
jgi:hypothetical protein